MKKNLLTTLAILCMSCGSAFATQQLVVEMTNGSKVRYVLSDDPVVTFSGSQVQIKSEKASASYEETAVSKYYFEEETNGIIEVGGSGSELRIDYSTPGQITIYGLETAANVMVFDIAGRQVSADVSLSGDAVLIGLSNLSSGVYIISLPKHPSIKIKK